MSARPYNGRPFACLLRLLLSNRKHRQQWRSRHAAFLPVCLSVFFVCLLASFLPQEHSTMAEQTWQLREERKKLPSIILHGRLLPSKKRSNLSTNRARTIHHCHLNLVLLSPQLVQMESIDMPHTGEISQCKKLKGNN